jgi:hypothetical protein
MIAGSQNGVEANPEPDLTDRCNMIGKRSATRPGKRHRPVGRRIMS